MVVDIPRLGHETRLRALLRDFPVVAVIGARQVGKTTIARRIARGWPSGGTFFDLEDARDLAQLEDPMLALSARRGLVVLDEVQRRPGPLPRVAGSRGPATPSGTLPGSGERLSRHAPAVLGVARRAHCIPRARRILAGRGPPATSIGCGCGAGSPCRTWPDRWRSVQRGVSRSCAPFSSVISRSSACRSRRRPSSGSGRCWPTITGRSGTRASSPGPSVSPT